MNELTIEYLKRAELWLLITTLVYFLMNGAQLFETAVIIPKWTKNAPQSLAMLQGPYAPDLKTFWIIAHTIHEITFIIAFIFTWKMPGIKTPLLIIFVLHFLVRIWTLGYFAPKIMAFQALDIEQSSSAIQQTVARWKNLNYLRVGAFIALSIGVAFLLWKIHSFKSATTQTKSNTMEQRLSVITIGVDDLKSQTEFYENKIGWQTVAANKDIVFFKLNGFLFSLFDRKTLASGAGVKPDGNGFRAVVLAYNVPKKEQVDQLHEEFKTKGIKIAQPPTPTPFGGYYFSFTDPEQNVFEVSFNPYIPLADDGNVITHDNIDNL